MHSTWMQPGLTYCIGCRRLRDGNRLKNMPLYVLKSSAGVEVHVRPIGCCIQRLLVPDAQGNLEDIVLGFDDLKPYSVRVGTGAHVFQVSTRLLMMPTLSQHHRAMLAACEPVLQSSASHIALHLAAPKSLLQRYTSAQRHQSAPEIPWPAK